MNRFDRITAILIHLQSRQVVQARDLAERFEVSLRTIYRDIRTLETAGVPIIGEAGVGYTIVDGYRLPPVMFTKEEAGSFVAAEKLMEKFTDATLRSNFQSAMYKIKAVLKSADKDVINHLENYIQINSSHTPFNQDIPDAMDILLKSIAERKIIKLNYQSVKSDNAVEREIEPVGIFHEHQYWYTMAFCHLRNDYRQFRADRIKGIKATDIPFTRKHGELDDYRKKDIPERDKIKVVLQVDKMLCPYLKERGKFYGFVSDEKVGDITEMTFLTEDIIHAFPRWYVTFADYAKIISPKDLQDNVIALLKKIQLNQPVEEKNILKF